MTVGMDPMWTLTMIIVLFGGGRLLLLAVLPLAVLYGIYRFIKWSLFL